MITELTEAQKAKMPEYARKWIEIGLSCEPADKAAVEEAVPAIYRSGGLNPPKRIKWYSSPNEMMLDRPRGKRNAFVGECIYGQHDANWLAFYEFFRNECGLVSQTEKLAGLTQYAKAAHWGLATATTFMACDRPEIIRRDALGRLHSLDAPAVRYRDGWSIYAVRGVLVDAAWVENKSALDPNLALTHPNVEQRAAAAALIGWNRVLDQLQPRLINAETDPNYDYGRLLEVDLPNEPGQKFLQVLCPTGRTMVLRVPPNMTTARQANAWTNGFDDPAQFAPEGRT